MYPPALIWINIIFQGFFIISLNLSNVFDDLYPHLYLSSNPTYGNLCQGSYFQYLAVFTMKCPEKISSKLSVKFMVLLLLLYTLQQCFYFMSLKSSASLRLTVYKGPVNTQRAVSNNNSKVRKHLNLSKLNLCCIQKEMNSRCRVHCVSPTTENTYCLWWGKISQTCW